MAEGLQRPRSRRGRFIVLTAALVAAVFIPSLGHALPRAATGPIASDQGYARASDHSRLHMAAGYGRNDQHSEEPANSETINANTIAIISGNPNGTYLSIAYDLSAVLDDGNEFRVLPIIGKGGAQNVRDVRYLKGVDLGITQSIILNTFRKNKDVANIDQVITYIAKLYNEEMHIIVRANSGITSIMQLNGKKVNFSDVGSGTQLSTHDIFEKLGITPVEVNMGQADALKKLQTGEIAATVLIAGKPAGSVGKVKAAEGFRLLPVPFDKALQTDYLPATLTARDYPSLIEPGRTVDTVAVGALLIAYNWPRNTDRYRRIEKFIERFFPRLAEFQRPPRHPKWVETNLAAVVPGWKRFPAAEEWLKSHNASTPNVSTEREQFQRFLETHPQAASGLKSTEQRDRLFQEFLRWNETREAR